MSNFSSFSIVSNAIVGTAPTVYTASTPDSLATILAPGYLNDIQARYGLKLNDEISINYADLSVFPLDSGENAIYGKFQVSVVGSVYSLVFSSSFSSLFGLGNIGFTPQYYVNAGGSATTTFNDGRINSASIVIARWQSSTNAVKIEKVTPANGSLTVLSSGDPGASVLELFVASVTSQSINAGIYAKSYTNAGGSATTSITDANISASSVVVANWNTSANAVIVEKVTPGAGTLTILSSADPGASVLSYLVINNGNALGAVGIYSSSYSNAGGSATTTITDTKITATSVVVADWNTSANAVQIEKVTPSANTLTILSSGDPGVSVLSYQVAANGV